MSHDLNMAVSKPGGGPNDGWNDPPLFSYDPTTKATSSPRRTLLNKRVSFPLSSGAEVAGEVLVPQDSSSAGVLLNPKDGPPTLPPIHILPPSMSTTVHPPLPVLVPSMSPPVDHSTLPPSFTNPTVRDHKHLETLPQLLERLQLDSADALKRYTLRIFHDELDACQDSIQGRSREDVQTRLSLLDDQWREGKLSEEARIKLGCLACALKNNDLKQADSWHLALMVDHIAEVNQWMVGVKRLINELKLSQSGSPLASPTSHFKQGDQSGSNDTTFGSGESVEVEDVCIDTDKLADFKPVFMPEMLISDPVVPDTEEVLSSREEAAHKNETERQSGSDSTKQGVGELEARQDSTEAADNRDR